MLRILGSASQVSHLPNRREVLRVGALGALGFNVPDWLRLQGVQAADSPRDATFGRAQRILLLYLQGAASQVETWDPKPNAPQEVRGPWGAIATSSPGTQICEKLPKMSQLVGQVALVRSMTHPYNNHSNHYTLTGYPTVDFTSE